MKKLLALLLCLIVTVAAAEIVWPSGMTQGQQQLQAYITRVNAALSQTGGGQIDVLHGLYPRLADLGMDGYELPDDPFAPYDPPAEISVILGNDGMHSIELRMQDPARYSIVAAAFINAASPESISLESARAIADAYAGGVLAEPNRSFSEEVNDAQGPQPRAYFAYFANQFMDEHNWIQLTIVFARPGSAAAPVIVPGSTPAPDVGDSVWLSDDNYTHLEVFVTPTPEPDSAAME